jgi:hypothetical protein
MSLRPAIGRLTFRLVYCIAGSLRRHGRVVAARRFYSACWRCGLVGWGDRQMRYAAPGDSARRLDR